MTWYVQLIRLDRGIRAGPKTRALLADDSYQKILCTDGLSAVVTPRRDFGSAICHGGYENHDDIKLTLKCLSCWQLVSER